MPDTLKSLLENPRYKTAKDSQKAQMQSIFTQQTWDNIKTSTAYGFGTDAGRQQLKNDFVANHPMGQDVLDNETRVHNTETKGNFSRGFSSGIDNAQATAGGFAALAADVIGNTAEDLGFNTIDKYADSVRDAGLGYSKAQQKEASLNQVDVQNFTDIRTDQGVDKTLEDTAKWAAGTFGMLAPSVLESITTATIGAMIGSAASPIGSVIGGLEGLVFRKSVTKAIEIEIESLIKKGTTRKIAQQLVAKKLLAKEASKKLGAEVGTFMGTFIPESGSMFTDAVDKVGVGNTNNAAIAGFATLSAASESVSPSGLFTKKIVGAGAKKTAKKVVKTGSDKLLKRLAKATGKATKTVAKSSAEEFGQEAFQEQLSIASENVHDPDNVSQFSKKSIKRTFNAGMAGAVGGLGFGSFDILTSGDSNKVKDTKRIDKIVNSEVQHDFKDKVAKAVKTGDVAKFIEPKSKTYDPKVGVKALHERSTKDDVSDIVKSKEYSQAAGVIKALDDKRNQMLDDAYATGDPDTINAAIKATEPFTKIRADIFPLVKAMDKTGPTSPELKKKLKAANDSMGIRESIGEILGSSGGGDIGNYLNFGKIADNPNIDAETKDLVSTIQTLADSQKALTEHISTPGSKSTKEVSLDIFGGGTEKGINHFIQAIQTGVNAKDSAAVKKELGDLKAFSDRHRLRATTFRKFMDGKITVKDEPLAGYNQERVRKGLPSYTNGPKFNSTVTTMELEANALEEAFVLGSKIAGISIAKQTAKAVNQENKTDAKVSKYKTSSDTRPGVIKIEKLLLDKTPTALQKMYSNMVPGLRKDVTEAFMVRNGISTVAGANTKVSPDKESSTVVESVGAKEAQGVKSPEPTSESKTPAASPAKASTKSSSTSNQKLANSGEEDISAKSDNTAQTSIADIFTNKKLSFKERAKLIQKLDIDTASLSESEREILMRIAANEDLAELDTETESIQDVLTHTEAVSVKLTDLSYKVMNRVRLAFKATKRKGVLNEVKDFAKWLKKRRVDKKGTNEDDFYGSMSAFSSFFASELKGVFKPKSRKDFHSKDPVQFLTVQGVLPTNLVSAMSAVSYNWLATQGRNTKLNDDKAIRKIVGVGKNIEVTDEARQLVGKLGTSAVMVRRNVGRDVLALIGIEAGEDATANEQGKLEESVGTLVLSNLQSMGLVKLNQVNQGVKLITDAKGNLDTKHADFVGVSDATQGLAGLKNKLKNQHNEEVSSTEFFNIKTGSKAKGTQTVEYYVIAHEDHSLGHITNEESTVLATEIYTIYNSSKDAWSMLFNGESDKFNYLWEPVKYTKGDRYPLGHSGQFATENASQNLNNSVNTPVVLNGSVINVLDMFDQDIKDGIYGYVDTSTVPTDQVKAAESENKRIELSQENVNFWLANAATQKDKYESVFYIPADFGANGRMYQRGTIRMQADKAHRFIFSLQEWKVEFETNGTSERDAYLQDSFMEAVGQSLSIEAGKEDSLEVVLTKTADALAKPEIKAALVVIDSLLEKTGGSEVFDPEMLKSVSISKTEQQVLALGIKEAGEKIQSLKGLVEYQRYMRAKSSLNGVFTTDISKEIDGKANGHFIAGIQLMATDDSLTTEQLSRFINTGLVLDLGMAPKDHKSNHDPYQDIAAKTGNNIETMKREALSKGDLLTDSKLRAVEYIMGSFTNKDGLLNKIARSLAKGRTTASLFGSSESSINAGMVRESVIKDGIVAKLIAIAQAEPEIAAKDLHTLTRAVRAITGTKSFGLKAGESAVLKGKTNKKAILGISVSLRDKELLEQEIARLQGAALNNAIGSVYKDIKTASKTLNKGAALATAYYNVAYKALIAEHGDKRLTNKDLAAIREKIKGIQPLYDTPDGGKIALFKYEKSTDYSLDSEDVIRQSYQNNKLKPGDPNYIQSVTGRPSTEGALENPRVGTIPGLVHNTDSTIQNHTMGLAPITNNHDGSQMSMASDIKISNMLNKRLYDVLSNHSIPGVVQRALGTSSKAFVELSKTLDITDTELVVMLQSEFRKFKLYSKNTHAVKGIVTEIADDINTLVPVTNSNRTELLSAAVKFNNYHHWHGGAKTGNKQQASINGIEVSDIIEDARASIDALVQDTQNQITPPVKDVTVEEVVDTLADKNTEPEKKIQYVQKPSINPKLAHHSQSKKQTFNVVTTLTGEPQITTVEGFYYKHPGIMEHEFFIYKEDKSWVISELSTGLRVAVGNTKQMAKKELEYMLTANPEVLAKGIDLARNTEEVVKPFTDTNSETLGSSLTEMSTDEAEYTRRIDIDNQDAVTVYNNIKNDSSIQDSPEHDARLTGILDLLVQNVMKPVSVFIKDNPRKETHGIIDPNEDGSSRLFISNQLASATPTSGALANGIRMSTGEVYTHELVHAALRTGLKLSTRLFGQVELLFNLAQKHIDYKAFLNDPTIDVKDSANRFEVQAAKARYAYIFEGGSVREQNYVDPATGVRHSGDVSNHVEEFLALGLTNENFVKALQNVSTVKLKQRILAKGTWSGVIASNIQETLVNIGNKIMELLYEKFSKNISKDSIHDELVRLAELLVKIDSKNKTTVFNKFLNLETKYRGLADKANNLVHQAFKSVPVLKRVYGLKVGIEQAYKSDSLLGTAMRTAEQKYKALDHKLLKSVVTEMVGNTVRMEPFHRLLHRRNSFLDATKESMIKAVKQLSQDIFKHSKTVEEKAALTQVGMRADPSYLLDHLSIAEITDVMGDERVLQDTIDSTVKEMNAEEVLQDHTDYFKQSSEALGHFMITGRFREGEVTFPYTKAIASLKGTSWEGELNTSEIDIADVFINRLASLYALQNTALKQRKLMHSIMVKDSEGSELFLRLHNELKAQALKDNFGNNGYQFIKGYTKDILNPRIDYRLGTLSEQEELKSQGYIRSEHPIERDPNDPVREDIYAYTSDTGRVNDWLSQIFSLSNLVSKGTDSQKIAQQFDLTTQEGRTNNATLIKAGKAKLDAMHSVRPTPTNDGTFMVPQVDANGNITKYRYMMTENTKDSFLERVNDYDTIMGAMAGAIVDKGRSPIINNELVDTLKVMFDTEYQANPAAYVEVSPHSDDVKLRELYYMMPAATRKHIKHRWGSDKMYVAKDVLTIAFGYRKYSIVQAFAKTYEERHWMEKSVVFLANGIFSKYGIKVVNNAELVFMALTRLAKNNIVVKTLYVTLENFGSNLMYLRSQGLTTAEILTVGWTALSQGLKYQADKQNLDQAKLKRKLLTDSSSIKKADLKISRLQDKISRNPVAKAIQAGLLPSLVDDVETDLTQDNFPSKLEKVTKKVTDKLPSPLVTVGKTILLTQDTSAYKLVNNAVKMTDFVGRYVLYTHYMKEGSKGGISQKAKKELHTESILKVMEEFVNFDLPTHKSIEYLNQTGLVWFSKYALRIQKIIYKSAINKPFDAFMSIMMSSAFGLDNIMNSTIGVTKDLFNIIGDPVSMFTDSVDKTAPILAIKSLFNH